MNASPDGSDTFLSCVAEQSVAASNNSVLEAQDAPLSQDSDAGSADTVQPIFTQAPAEPFSDEDDEDGMESTYQSLSPNVATGSSINRPTTPTPPATQDSPQSIDTSSDDFQSQSPQESANPNSTTTPESHNPNDNRNNQAAAAGWVRPDLLSRTANIATKRDSSYGSTLVVQEKELPDSPAVGWPLHAFDAQQQQHAAVTTNNSGILASSPESSAPSGFPPQHTIIGNAFYLTQPQDSGDSKEFSKGFAPSSETASSPSKPPPPLSQPDSTRKEALLATPLHHESSPNSQSSGGGFDGMRDSSPEVEQPQDVARTAPSTTPMHGPARSSTDDNEASSSEEEEEDDDDDDKEEEKKELTREERIQRNKDRLVFLGLMPPDKSQTPTCVDATSPDGKFVVKSPTGMLFVSPCSKQLPVNMEGAVPEEDAAALQTGSNCSIDELYERFPHRQTQIRTLISLIGTTMGQNVCQGDTPYVPAPIFVSGPSGCGKTSIVRDTVETLQRHYSSNLVEGRVIGTAYVNCAAIEPSSLEAVLESAYSQLVPLDASRRPKQAKRPKRKRKTESATSDEPNAKQLKSDASSDGVAAFDARLPPQDADIGASRSNDGDYNSDNESEMEDMMEESKAQLSQMDSDEKKPSGSAVSPPSRRITRHSTTAVRNRRASDTNVPNAQKKTIRKTESITKSHGAPVAFGRVISPFFGPASPLSTEKKPGSAFLILDHAERLFTLSASQKAEPNNFLAQLLLLPQVMGLNLTVIIVSRSALLDCSRINNSAPIQKALGTIASGIRPVRVHFPAYRGNAEFKAILKQPKIVELIVGKQSPLSESDQDDRRRKYQECTIDSFLDTLVQSLSGITRATREMIRVGRALWPTYVLPLDPRNIQSTLNAARLRRSKGRNSTTVESVLIREGSVAQENASAEDLQKEILAILDEAILPRMKKCLEEELFTMKGDDTYAENTLSVASSSQYDLPFLSKCLLLAAFVCQTNKPDKDKALFTIQKNGKKNNRQGHRVGNNDAEGLAFGSTTWEQQRLKMLRPRTFPLERMLSVFVNIVGLIGGEERLRCSVNNSADTRDLLSSIGSTCFFENLARLREIGLLHEVQGPSIGGGDGFSSFDGVNLVSTKYWCELNRDDAEALAASVDFPLANFLI